jgi:CubicO group peptidase (beta-lactamase class C family)
MTSAQMKYAMCLALSALPTVGLESDAAPAAADLRGTNVSWTAGEARRSGAESLNTWIDSVRRQHNVPAMGAIVFRADTVLARGIAGVRRSNSTAPVEERDRFQLGSNTKAITATVLATLVEEGKLTWTSTLADVFPEWRDSVSPDFRPSSGRAGRLSFRSRTTRISFRSIWGASRAAILRC